MGLKLKVANQKRFESFNAYEWTVSISDRNYSNQRTVYSNAYKWTAHYSYSYLDDYSEKSSVHIKLNADSLVDTRVEQYSYTSSWIQLSHCETRDSSKSEYDGYINIIKKTGVKSSKTIAPINKESEENYTINYDYLYDDKNRVLQKNAFYSSTTTFLEIHYGIDTTKTTNQKHSQTISIYEYLDSIIVEPE